MKRGEMALAFTIFIIVALLALWIMWGLYIGTTEQAAYEVIEVINGVEIREYPAQLIASTVVTGEGNLQNEAFRILADYIFGNNRAREKIAMTAPVESEKIAMTAPVEIAMTAPVMVEEQQKAVRMVFFLPAKYTMETVPIPASEKVKIEMVEPRRLAVLRFGWIPTEKAVRAKEQKLAEILDKNGIEAKGQPFLMQYNDPWTPPFMRRNEVAVRI